MLSYLVDATFGEREEKKCLHFCGKLRTTATRADGERKGCRGSYVISAYLQCLWNDTLLHQDGYCDEEACFWRMVMATLVIELHRLLKYNFNLTCCDQGLAARELGVIPTIVYKELVIGEQCPYPIASLALPHRHVSNVLKFIFIIGARARA